MHFFYCKYRNITHLQHQKANVNAVSTMTLALPTHAARTARNNWKGKLQLKLIHFTAAFNDIFQ
jgi:hypothetical protein